MPERPRERNEPPLRPRFEAAAGWRPDLCAPPRREHHHGAFAQWPEDFPGRDVEGETRGLWDFPWQELPAAVSEGARWGGVVLVALGLWLRISAMRRLGTRFSPKIAVQPEHALETGGAYAHVRHPGYVGALLATAGAILAFGSLIAWPLLAIMWIAQNARASREESVLSRHFGDAWQAYAARTGRFVPRLGSHPPVS